MSTCEFTVKSKVAVNRFVKNDEMASHLDETYWRNNKVDRRFEAHANQAEATAGDVGLLGDHMAEVWEYTRSMYAAA